MGDLILKGGTSGQITLTPTAVAGTNTLTLPAKTGNIITSADSGTVTQTMLGTNVAGTGPAFSVTPSAAQTVANVTAVTMACDVENYDTAGCFNNTGSTVTLNGLSVPAYSFCPNVAGYYLLVGSSYYALSSGVCQPIMGGYAAAYVNNSSGVNPVTSIIVYLNGAGNSVKYELYQSSGGSYTTLANRGDLYYFMGCLLRAA